MYDIIDINAVVHTVVNSNPIDKLCPVHKIEFLDPHCAMLFIAFLFIYSADFCKLFASKLVASTEQKRYFLDIFRDPLK